MQQENILVVGALGQIGSDLMPELQSLYGEDHVVAADIVEPRNMETYPGKYEHLNILDKERLRIILRKHRITQVYLLAAILSAKGESNPQFAWRLNMESLLNVLDAAVANRLRIFWPSSIAVFGPGSPQTETPQFSVMDPLTIYGISKLAGERWAEYYHLKHGVDIRSLRYPGLISYKALPGGGTTDYAVDIFYKALERGAYTCFLAEDTALPMMYMPDAIRATLELMQADAQRLRIWSSYNLAGISFAPLEIADRIRATLPGFTVDYQPDFRQEIAESWPRSIDDHFAKEDWDWQLHYDLQRIVDDMLLHLSQKVPRKENMPGR